jgi:DNA recombination protein RmuC
MNPLVLAAGFLAIAAVIGVLVWITAQRFTKGAVERAEAQMTAVRQEMQGSLAAQNQLVTSQMNHLAQTLTQQLGQVRQELQAGVATSGQLTSDAQRDVAERLKSSTDALVQMTQKMGEMHQASQDLSKATQTLQSVLGGAKTRGMLGEVTLERMLEDALPRAAYATQYKFASTGAIVDAIVRSGERVLSIDSKFPLEAYRRLGDGGGEARREFCQAVRGHADSIAKKYILPTEQTFDYAMMFVPSEGVYYEMIATEDAKYGPLDAYCRSKQVIPVSPNTFYACLSAVAMSLQSQKMEENARQLMTGLAGLKKQFDDFGTAYDKVGTHLRNAQKQFDEATNRLSKANVSLEQMAKGALPEGQETLVLEERVEE